MTRALRATAAALLGALCLAVSATAVVPPKSCGTMTVKGKRYQIKADQVTCATAKRYSYSYLRSGRRPSGWRVTKYPASSRFKFRMYRGTRNIYAIKR